MMTELMNLQHPDLFQITANITDTGVAITIRPIKEYVATNETTKNRASQGSFSLTKQ